MYLKNINFIHSIQLHQELIDNDFERGITRYNQVLAENHKQRINLIQIYVIF